MPWIYDKPKVYWDGYFWCSLLEHEGWFEGHQFTTWDKAMDDALWLGLCAGLWTP